MRLRRLPVTALALTFALATLAPVAAAATVSSTVFLHDLYQDNDPSKGYIGCHVTTSAFATYRFSVPEGSHVVLTVEAFENNTNAHFLTVEGADGRSETITGGQSTTFEFDVDGAGSRAVKCDGQTSDLQGVLIVQPSGANANGGSNGTPAPGPVAFLALAAVGALALGRARRRGDA